MPQCPSRERWLLYLGEGLPRPDSDDMDDHLSSCDPCTRLLDQLSAPTLELQFAFRARSARLPEIPGYNVTRELGSGGMGVVYLADQRSPSRQVALKMIQTGPMVMERHRSRFQIEANAMAQLQHPHIAQVFEVGSVDDQPYIAMEFLGGGSLKDPSHIPPTASAAAEFVRTLALAVQHAHDRGVIHRDLKPANVLFTGDGVAKLCDFGLAKLADTPSDLTQDAVIGTAPYMAPEQASGSSEVTVQTDVYALGAVLYELLCDRPPFHVGSRPEILDQVRFQEPSFPRTTRIRIPRDLETITLKCLEKSPEKRYQRAADLADDLGNLLEGRTINARPALAPEKAIKWVKRHPLVTLSLAFALIGPSLLAGVTGWFNVRLQESNANLAVSRDQESARFTLAMEAIRTFHSGVSEDFLLKEERFSELRNRLLRSPEEFYRKLEATLKDTDKSDIDSRLRLADVYFDLAILTESVGNQRNALANLERARDIQQAVVGDRAATQDMKDRLNNISMNIGRLIAANGHQEDGVVTIDRSIRLQEELCATSPDSIRYAKCLSLGYTYLGNVRRGQGRDDEAEHAYRQALDICTRLAKTHPENYDVQLNLAKASLDLGSVTLHSRRPDQALAIYVDQLKALEVLRSRDPKDYWVRRNIAIIQTNLGVAYRSLGMKAEGLRSYESARSLFEELVSEQPASIQLREGLASCLGNLALWLGENHRPDEGSLLFKRALQIQSQLAADQPTRNEYRYDLACTHLNNGCILSLARRHDEAIPAFREAESRLRSLAEAQPEVMTYRYALGGVLLSLSDSLIELDRAAEARPHSEEGIQVVRLLVQGPAANLAFRSLLGQLLTSHGSALVALGQPKESIPEFQESIEHQRAAYEASPNEIEFRQQLGRAYTGLAKALRALGRRNESDDLIEKRLDLCSGNPDELYDAASEFCSRSSVVGDVLDWDRWAIEALQRASKAGFRDVARLRADTAFRRLQEQPAFRLVLDDLGFPAYPFKP